jgi:protein TonB
MIDVVRSYHSPIFDTPKSKKLTASFYWGVLFAVLLHLALIFYFVNHTFSLAPVDTPSEPKATGIELITLPTPPPPTPQTPPVNRVVLHPPVNQTPVTVDTIPVDPKPDTSIAAEGPVTTPVLSPATGGTASSAAVDTYVKARWTRFPDANALGQYYPERAANDEVEGVATVECVVLDQAGHVSCRALSEVPGNYGFGKATVRMVQDKGRVDTSQGDVKIGSVLRTSVKWQLG